MKVNDIVKYIGEESDEIPFKQGDLILLKREEAEGYAAVPFDKPKSKEATLVYTSEVEEIDEEEEEAARDEAEKNADEDAAEAAAQQKKLEAAEKKAANKEAAAKKTTTPSKDAATRKTQKSTTAKKKTAATKKTATTKDEEAVAELKLTKEVTAALKGKSAVRAARDLIAAGTISDFTLGGVLAKIAADKDFEKEVDPETGEAFSGHKGFEAFIERDLGIRYRKAQWLIEFYTTFANAGVDPKKLAKAKYSKIKEVLAIVRAKPEEAEDWIDKSNSSKFEELKEEARRYERKIGIQKKARGTNDATMISYKFKVFNAQAKNVDEAIDKAKSLIEFEDKDSEAMRDAKAIYHIFSEWLQLQG